MVGPLPKVFFSFTWVCFWSLSACQQFTMTYLEANLPNLKLLTPAQAANAHALQKAIMWVGAAGAWPAFLAMLLRGRGRVRRALAGAGLAAAVAIHCVLAWLMGVTLVAAPSQDLLGLSVLLACVFVLFAGVDAHAARVLLRRHGGKE